jgi:hypothetical protein
LHPWCDQELLQEVLSSVDNNTAAAAAALADLAPAGSGRQSVSKVSLQADRGDTAAAGGGGSSYRDDVSATVAVQSSSHSASGTVQQQQQQQEQEQQQEEPGSGDIYHRVRSNALRLTRQWQKVLRR